MANAFRLLDAAVTARPVAQVEYRWEDLMRAMQAVISVPLGWEAEQTLLAVTRFEGSLHLSEESEVPHSMPPEDMLKSLAIQALARWTGLTHLKEMQRVEATTSSPVLRTIVRAVIRQAQAVNMPATDLEATRRSPEP